MALHDEFSAEDIMQLKAMRDGIMQGMKKEDAIHYSHQFMKKKGYRMKQEKRSSKGGGKNYWADAKAGTAPMSRKVNMSFGRK